MKRKPVLTLLVSVALASAGTLAGTPQNGQADCLRNGKQLALAAIMFASDYNDKFAFTAANYKTKLMPYMKNAGVLTCPLDKAGTMSYSFNSAIANVSMMQVEKPAQTVLFYEGKAKRLNYRHGGKAVVAFCDGHVVLIGKDAAKRLVWKP